jgi:hypothetical protein
VRNTSDTIGNRTRDLPVFSTAPQAAVPPRARGFGGLVVSMLASGTFGGLVVSMLASGTQDHGFAPGRSRRIFSGGKILSMPSFGKDVQPFTPCRRFAACQRTL